MGVITKVGDMGLFQPRRIEKRRRIVAAGLFALAVACLGRSAAGQNAPDRVSPAVALFDDAKEMMDKGHFAEACPKLAESQALDPQVGTMLNLALCYETVGKTASACMTWRDAAAAAALKAQIDREEFARERAEGVCGRVPRVTVRVVPQSRLERVELKINEAAVPRDRWGLPEPVDPGQYEVRASGEGLQPWSSTFLVDAQHDAVVVVPEMAQVSPPEPPAPEQDRSAGLRTAGWVAGTVGLAALGVGAAFGIAAIENNNASKDARNCVGNNCNSSGDSDRTRALDDARTTNVMLAVGGAALVTAAVLWIVAIHAQSMAHDVPLSSHPLHPAPRVFLKPAVGPEACSFTFGGAW